VSTRTIVEINHDYLHDLKQAGHISREVFNVLCEATSSRKHYGPIQGLRVLAQRHHSETLELKVE
jgi:hypothetical protein